jgi:tRNA pseudouridine55 synthase
VSEFGLLLVDKPVGPTSHKVVSIVRSGTKIRKVGHAGTLDPRASGLLILCLGPATRLSEYLSTSTKEYEAQVEFGQSTETYDAEGEPTQPTGEAPSLEAIESVLPSFRGPIEQVPPPFSAVKVKGRKAYEMAREGKQVDLQPRQVTIFQLEIIEYDPPELALRVECSAGTYIRSLAHDLGTSLGTGAHLAGLRRLRSGTFGIEDAIPLNELEKAIEGTDWQRHVLPASEALPEFPIVSVRNAELERIRNGLRIPGGSEEGGMARAVSSTGELVAILESIGDQWHPRKVFLR